MYIDRRTFFSCATAFGAGCTFLPLQRAFAGEPVEILWSGLSLMRACPPKSKKVRHCSGLEDYFPNIYTILKDEENENVISQQLRDVIEKQSGQNSDIKIVWGTDKNNYEVKDTDYGMFLGITSDREIAHEYEPEKDVTVLIFELQMYLFVLNVERYEVVQSYPLRFLELDMIKGEINEEVLPDKMWDLLTGKASTTKGQLLGIGRYDLPTMLPKALAAVHSDNTGAVNLRVTEIDTRPMTRNWVASQNKKVPDFESILGNSLSAAITETMKIGIQPYMPTEAIADLTEIYASTVEGKSSAVLQKNLNFAPIELDLRLVSRGMKVKTEQDKRYETIKKRKVIIGLEIIAGRWERTYEDKQRQFVTEEKLVEKIFHQRFRAITLEVVHEAWTNDWYWVIDLHHRLFTWFFEKIHKGDYPGIFRGQNVRHKSRQFLLQVVSKEFSGFETEAKNLRKALL
ncbi:MAG: hypothetical protein VYA17_10285 [Pseudomonadota bacterium]|nr:hypothetical protein [Pseudomonadota bacterium]